MDEETLDTIIKLVVGMSAGIFLMLLLLMSPLNGITEKNAEFFCEQQGMELFDYKTRPLSLVFEEIRCTIPSENIKTFRVE